VRFDWEAIWGLFDGDRDQLNIAYECLDRHPPTAIAARIVADDGTTEVATFGELSAATARFAHLLRERGVRAGDRVGVMMDPSPALYTAMFGVIKHGAVAVPLYTLFGPDAVRERLEDCGARLLVTGPDVAAVAAELAVEHLLFDDGLERALAAYEPTYEVSTAASDPAVLQYTSGTTRQLPEAVPHDHRAVVTVARAALYGLGIARDDRYFCPSHPAWGHGLWHGTIAPWLLGVPLGAYRGRFSAERLLDALVTLRVDNLAAASTVYRMLLATGRLGQLRSLRKASYTGEELDADAQRAFREQVGVPVCGMYGTTETGVIVVNFPGFPDHVPKPGALGRPMPGCQLAVLDDAGDPVAAGTVGEISVWRRGGWLRSKDLGWADEAGYLHYAGRADDVIISAGWTISPLEVERTLLTHPFVEEVAVVGAPDSTRGLVVKAYVVTSGPDSEALATELQDLVRERLGRHEYPRQLEFVTVLPRTPNGKIDRRALRAVAAATP
jgi:acetyl-CoA synthetase